MTQAALAALLDVSQQGVSRRLSGRTPFTLDELDLLAASLDVPLGYLMGLTNSQDNPRPTPDGGITVEYRRPLAAIAA